MRLSILESVEGVQDLSVLRINKVHRERSGNLFLIMNDMDIQAWYTRTATDTRIKSKVVPVVYYNLVIRR